MFEKTLKEEDIFLTGLLRDPVVMAETLFTPKVNNLESLKNYSEKDNFKVRLYQLPFLNYSYLLCPDPELSDIENFNLMKGAGEIYMFCGRNIGKSVFLILDMCMEFISRTTDWVALFSSCSGKHVAHILEPFIVILENHPFFKLFQKRIVRNPSYKITTKSGYSMEGVNANITGKSPGQNFESLRGNSIHLDEIQADEEIVAGKRSQAVSELGAIRRFAGITSFTRTSPAGKIFDNLDKKSQIINLSEYVSPYWTDEKYQDAIDDYNGESSWGFLVNVKAEICESVKSLLNMDRVSLCYSKEHPVKRFEISKDDIPFLKEILILDRLKNSEKLTIAADYGETAHPTEIILVERIGERYKYYTNIVLQSLVPKEQIKVFEFLINELNPNVIALDATSGGGRELFRRIVEFCGERYKNNLVRCSFNEKMKVGFETDNEGKVKIDLKSGEPTFSYERVDEFSISYLKKIIYYKDKIELGWDSKLHKQFASMKAANIGNGRITYGSTEPHDLFQAFQCFALAEFLTEPNNLTQLKPQKPSIGAFFTL